MKKIFIKSLLDWIPFAVVIIGLSGLAYGAVQQNYRTGLNDPQIQLAQNISTQITLGKAPKDLLPPGNVDLSGSLNLFVGIYDKDGKPVAVNGKIGDQDAQPPTGSLQAAAGKTDNRFTWQPNDSTRVATIAKEVKDQKQTQYFIAVGRNMSEGEARIKMLTQMTGLAMLILLVVTLLVLVIKNKILNHLNGPTT